MKRLVLILICMIGFLLISWMIGSIILSFQFKKEVKVLFSLSSNISNNKVNFKKLDSLPKAVQRYFRFTLNEGMPYINYVRMTHNGQFKTSISSDWVTIKGEQYATTQKPAFIWKGKTNIFTARDMYIADKGRLVVSLFSLYNIVDAQGEQYNQGELLRWLGESVLYPTNLLPSNRLKWSEIDANTSKLTFNYNGLSLFFIVTFNEIGEITQMETNRYMDEKHLETWVIKLANYKKMNDIIVPTTFEVLWRLKTGDFSYVKFNMQKIEYDKPAIF
jgi:hypothetical protein